MRYGIVSDIHANYDALEAVLEALTKEKIDKYVCVGDVVGYGAEPKKCVEKTRELCTATVAGNHDFATIEKTNIEFFNIYAKEATLWTRARLDDADKEWLRSLKLVEHINDKFTIVHGSLYAPALFDYVQTSFDAYLSLQIMKNDLCFIGHSHVPIAFFLDEAVTYSVEPELTLAPGVKAIINVGSVGQPRDDNPKAAYAVYDTEQKKVWIKRVEYDIDSAASKIVKAGLPAILGERLRYGR